MKHTLIRTVPEEAPQTDAFSGCGRGPAPAARRAANAPPIFVNGVAIAESAIAQEAQNHGAASGPEARAAAARALVIRELILQRARALGLTAQPFSDHGGREETGEEALIRQVLEREAPGAEPSETECRRLYAASAARFTAPELFAASHILFAPAGEDAAAWAAAHASALEAIKALGAGADFAALAREHSACPSGAEGGTLGQLRRGDLTEDLETALLALEEGQTGPSPVRSRHGWHLVRLERRAPARQISFEAVKDLLAEELRLRAALAASARYVARLADAARIEGVALTFEAVG